MVPYNPWDKRKVPLMVCRQGPPPLPTLSNPPGFPNPKLYPQCLCSGQTLTWGCLLPWCLPYPLHLCSGVHPPESPISFHLPLCNAPHIPMHNSVLSIPTRFPASPSYMSDFLTRWPALQWHSLCPQNPWYPVEELGFKINWLIDKLFF